MTREDKRPGAAVVALDAMGGDFAPREVVAGALGAARADPDLRVILVGDLAAIRPLVTGAPDNVELHHASQAIGMSEHPAKSVREKTDAPVVVAARLVKEGKAGAFVSAGNTGAAMSAALVHMGRVEGVARPAIAVVAPAPKGPVVLLDAGANADCKPEWMAQFGVMGAAYSACLLKVDNPKIGLLNIGQESGKGSQLYQAAHELLGATEGICFVGNVEGGDLFEAKADVVVTDGFTGNVVLKVVEGVSEMLFEQLREAMTASAFARIGGLMLRSRLGAVKAKIDHEEYGGAQLLGVNGGCVIAHGGSKAKAIGNALRVAAQVVRNEVVAAIAAQVS